MKKLINDKNNIVEEVVQGMIKAFPDKVSRVENEPIIIRRTPFPASTAFMAL